MHTKPKQKKHALNQQIQNLLIHFSSIENEKIRKNLVSFVERIGELSGLEFNHKAVISALKSEDFFDKITEDKNDTHHIVTKKIKLVNLSL